MDLTATARGVFATDRYATALTGIVIDNVGHRTSQCSLALSASHRNAVGAAMGGAIFTLADFAAAVAANSMELENTTSELHWVSLDATIHYLSPALGGRLVAQCSALKHGRSTALYQTTVSDPDSGRTVAVAETTMMRV